MRLKIEFTQPTELMSINNQSLVNSYIHKVLGNNNSYHDSKSNYCISQLHGGKMVENKMISFNGSPYIIVSSDDMIFMNKIMLGLLNTKDFCHGMSLKNIIPINEEFFNGWNHFFTLSPILLKQQAKGEKVRFITTDDENYEEILKNHIIKKLTKIDKTLDLKDFEIEIDTNFKKVRKVLVKNVINHASSFKISIRTNKRVAAKLYHNGLGQSTGCGFGVIYKTENYNLYKYCDNKLTVIESQ